MTGSWVIRAVGKSKVLSVLSLKIRKGVDNDRKDSRQ
jgi:hypothetical protein